MSPRAVVVGACNLDIGGRSAAPLAMGDSNPGEVVLGRGGVGFNIARALARGGVATTLLTAFGDDLPGRAFARAAIPNLDLSQARVLPGAPTGLYVYIAAPDGTISVAVNDTRAAEAIGKDYLLSKADVLNSADIVIIEANLSPEAIETVASIVKRPIWADPVSTIKAPKLEAVFPRLALLKPNLAELASLSGTKITDRESFVRACRILLDKGIGSLLVSLGPGGAVLADGSALVHQKARVLERGDATGAGDSLLAGFAAARARGLGPKESLEAAVDAGTEAAAGRMEKITLEDFI